ncbi:MAG: choice-of-anchor A family protein, partial [Actinobacteria bacterium]|nr:choice-of-anchor A family protein [Actinomycetota bacterium]
MSSPTASTGDTNAEARITQRRAGTALAVVGAVLLGIGVFTSTGATVQPLCPTGTKLVAKFTWTGSKYRFDEPSGNSKVVTISSASATGGRFDATRPIASVVVKGGPGSKDSWITPAATSGTFTNAGLPSSGGRTPNIDTVQFCVATAVNPSTAAAGFDVVTKGDAVLAANESEGPVAIGGNVRFDQYQVAVHSAGTFKVAASDTRPTALLVKGKADMSRSRGQLTVEDGWIAIGIPKGVTAKRTNPNQIVVNATSARIDALPRILGQSSAQSLPSATRSSSFDFNGAFTTWKSLAEGLARCDATVKLAGA